MNSKELNSFRLLDDELNRNQMNLNNSNESKLNQKNSNQMNSSEFLLILPLSHVIRCINNEIRLNCPEFYKRGWDIGIENKGFPRLIIRRNNANSARTVVEAKQDGSVGGGKSPILPCFLHLPTL